MSDKTLTCSVCQETKEISRFASRKTLVCQACHKRAQRAHVPPADLSPVKHAAPSVPAPPGSSSVSSPTLIPPQPKLKNVVTIRVPTLNDTLMALELSFLRNEVDLLRNEVASLFSFIKSQGAAPVPLPTDPPGALTPAKGVISPVPGIKRTVFKPNP